MRRLKGLRRSMRKALRSAGLERVRNPTFVDVMQTLHIETVLDVGANEGQYVSEIRELGFKGKIHSFEPIRQVFDKLTRNSQPDELWEVHNFAFGENAGEAAINVSDDTVFSSFKAVDSYLVDSFEASVPVRTEHVTVRRLEDFLDENRAAGRSAYLKIDTQGFEREVLAGAGRWLDEIKAVQVELPMRSLYQDQPAWLEMVKWFTEHEFEVAMAKENGYNWDPLRLLELDVVFVRALR